MTKCAVTSSLSVAVKSDNKCTEYVILSAHSELSKQHFVGSEVGLLHANISVDI